MSRALAIVWLWAAVSLPAAPARAGCAPPAPELVWSYPSDGQTGVPTNATIWILLPNWTQPESVSLDGVEIPVNGFGFGYVPDQPLAPGSPHQVTFRATPARVQPPVQLTIRFTTGPGPAETTPPAPPAVLWASASATRDLAPACQRALDAMECVDTGPRFHLIFTTDAMPLLWIIESSAGDAAAAPSFELWPGSCGLPEVFVDEGATRACNRRYRLHALTEAGLRAMTPSLCPGDLVKMPLPPSPVMPDAGVDPGVQPPPDQSGTDGGAPSTGGGGTGGGPGPRGTDPAVHETESRSGCAFGGGGAGGGQAIVLLLLLALVRRRWSPR